MAARSFQELYMSAQALSIYDYCHLRFRFRYLDNLYWSKQWASTSAERAAMERGQNFHLMARRYFAGIDPARVADPVEQRELDAWLGLLQGFLPRSFDISFYPELELRLNRQEMRLLAKFDLVAVDPDGRATIYDWKTEKRFPQRRYLINSMQTMVYRYMLCTAGGTYSPNGRFAPEQVSMVYWNPLFPHRWERLDYSEAQYQKDEAQLRNVISTILRTPRDRFAATTNLKNCAHCEYRPICHGRRSEAVDLEDEPLIEATLSWDQLPDLP